MTSFIESVAKILSALFGPIPETPIRRINKSFASSERKPYKLLISSYIVISIYFRVTLVDFILIWLGTMIK